MTDLSAERRRRLTHRAVPALAGLALVAAAAGMMVGARVSSAAERTARSFTEAWARQDYRAMYGLLDDASRRAYSAREFRRAYRDAAATATVRRVAAGDPAASTTGPVAVPIVLHTRVFGRLSAELRLPVNGERVTWGPLLAFPGLRRGEGLIRRSQPARRGTLLSRDGKVLARGPVDDRSSPLEAIAGSIAGTLAPEETAEERTALYAQGFPRDWPVGQNGLEEAFENRLAGRPGGELLAGTRVLARARPKPAAAVRTTIDTRLQEAAVTALAGRFGGIAALDPRNGEIRALAGIAFSAPQPPGSTFKIVTTAAALEAGAVKPTTEFPVATAATIDGVELENANGEYCGGTFRNSFAHSCNSVFAPLGVEVGAERLVDAAERFGWNGDPTVPGRGAEHAAAGGGDQVAARGRLDGDRAVPHARHAAADGVGRPDDRGARRAPPADAVARATRPQRARDPAAHRPHDRVADDGRGRLRDGHGGGAAGGQGGRQDRDRRAGGHARPRDRRDRAPDPTNTDAWFTAYAPAGRPKIAVAVMLVRAGAGGATAAPAARVVLDAAL